MTDVPRATLVIRGLRRYWGVVPAAIVVAVFALRACLAASPLDNLAPAPSAPDDPPGTTARVGSLAILRGGPVLIGYQSPSPARLELDAKPLRDCHPITGGQLCRVIEMQGAVAIRFASPPGARLVWSPVGRRGDPEYLPASSLSPDPSEHAEFSCPGTSKLDGVLALALVITIIATLLGLARRRLARVPRAMWLAMAAVFAVALIVRLIDLGGAGQTWDEDVNWAAGRDYITNLLALDFRLDSWAWNFEHPPMMKYLVGIGAQLSDGFGPARAISAVTVAIGCALLVPIGARLYSLRAGALAAAIAALLPPLVAHGQIVGHEAPTVLWWSLGVLLALGVHDDDPDRRTFAYRIAWVGVVVGLATASRFVNGLLGPLCVALVIARAPSPRRTAARVWSLTLAPAVAVATFYVVWPRLWFHPIDALVESFHKLDNQHAVEPFLGTITNQPGPHYFIVYLVATLPVGVLAAVLVWLASVIREPAARRSAVVVGLWFVIALGVSLSPVRQDGVRYVMPCLLAFAIAAGAGIDQLACWLGRWRHAFTALAAAIVIYLGVVDVRTHPYYLDYFGEQVGGAGTVAAHGWFETAWWGEGVDRAVDYVNDHAARGAHVYRRCIEPVHLAWFRQDLWLPMTESINAADWIVAYSTAHCAIPKSFHAVYTVDFDGAVLATVYQR